jgi:sugar phosphate isomerase/epimerase
MKLSFSTLGCPSWPLDKIIKAVKHYGFDGVELRGIEGELDIRRLRDFSGECIAETRALFENAGAETTCVDSSASFSHKDTAILEACIKEARDYIETAAGLGASLVRIFGQ